MPSELLLITLNLAFVIVQLSIPISSCDPINMASRGWFQEIYDHLGLIPHLTNFY